MTDQGNQMEPSGRPGNPATGDFGGKHRRAPQALHQARRPEGGKVGTWPERAVSPRPRRVGPASQQPAQPSAPETPPEQPRLAATRRETAPAEPQSPPPPQPPDDEPKHARRAPVARPTRFGTFLRGISGSLAYGFVVLALSLIGMQIWAGQHGWTGPGIGTISGHVIGGVVAVFLQAVGDHRRDRTGAAAISGVLVVVLGSLWFWWWL